MLRKYDLSGQVSKIADGVLHAKKNNLPEELELGRKGIPVVVKDHESQGLAKHAEIEVDELIVPKDKSKIIEKLAYQYHTSKNPSIALELGRFMKQEILTNTLDSANGILKRTK